MNPPEHTSETENKTVDLVRLAYELPKSPAKIKDTVIQMGRLSLTDAIENGLGDDDHLWQLHAQKAAKKGSVKPA